jgi:hypothetical protein
MAAAAASTAAAPVNSTTSDVSAYGTARLSV